MNTKKGGRNRIDYPACISPTIGDIREAAGFYEGEGHFNKNKEFVSIGQNDREKLDWLKVRFGGKVYGPYTGFAGNDIYSWRLSHERAHGFMLTIFTFLSKSRREQFISGSNRGYKQSFIERAISKHLARKQGQLVKGPMKMFGVRK